MKLELESHRDVTRCTTRDVLRAVAKLATPNGPTFIVLVRHNGDYAQAAGTDGRYVIESRTVYGEGFRHYRVFHDIAGPDSDSVIHYLRQCRKKLHSPRKCPLPVRESEVSCLEEVEQALIAFHETAERDPTLRWRDISDKWPITSKADDEFASIPPRRGEP